ncbi:chitin-binding protein [Streptomyces sp. Ru73]|uniref:lytic polysaccharide monooxygenase n=1 Tax=Streptomyces sp. Ru73 TaxID=2080748 RepID=UPI000CDD2641|nr:lytic polysaccharide monooxygenase [Streptomyces sp. Ru73]POX36071.1 chitin-binding protein [Streptomyces sp. Ru73]
MTALRKATGIAVAGLAPLALTVFAAHPAAAHGSMTDPVSRISACYAEGPESPDSAACKAMVAAGGVQALYDWNGVRDGAAGGQSRTRIPDGKLCSANSEEYKGLDLARDDWPASPMAAGAHTFRYKATAPHKGTFELYLTKDGYDPSKPLKWSDLEAKPFAKVTNPELTGGDYVFEGKVPARSGRHLIYSIWQRSDSPEAFYTCSDVVFGKGGGSTGSTAGDGAESRSAAAPAPAASAPTEQQLAAGADKSSMNHMHHGGAGEDTHADGGTHTAPDAHTGAEAHASTDGARPHGSSGKAVNTALAETGGNGSTGPLAVGGAAVLALGASVLFAVARRKAARNGG